MSCTNCIQTTASITGFVPANCQSTNPCYLDAGCVVYTGPALNCSGIETNDALDTILQKIDPLLCTSGGDYSTYNTFCLAPITTQQEFVESISEFVCDLRDEFDTFTETTFPDYQQEVETALETVASIAMPQLTCASAGVTSIDNLSTILTKYCTKFGQIDALLNVSSATWNSCYLVDPLPVNPTQGFNAIISQICLLKAQVEDSAVLPTFNNEGSCLPTPLTAADTLVDTINKIKTRLCQTGTIDTTTLSWGCVPQPSGAQNLQDTLQNILTEIQAVAQSLPTQWSADFTVDNVDNLDLCLGKSIELAIPPTQDRFVAATGTDLFPGTLQGKMTAGTNISFDFTTTLGQMIINCTLPADVGDHKVGADASDTEFDFLDAKIAAGAVSNGLQVVPVLDTSLSNHQIKLNANVDPIALFTFLLESLDTDSGLYTLFCQKVAGCPSPCAAPSNVVVTYSPGPTTTTTTTTSTTTTTTTTP